MKCWSVIFTLGAAFPLQAQSTIAASQDKVYSANAGWIGLDPASGDGVKVTEFHLAGYAIAANFGWINFGNGSPENGYAYNNDSQDDFGINLSADGLLSGRAYSANVGWITFEQTHGKPRLNLATGKFLGSAYSANMGWISLETGFSDLVTTRIESPDSDADGISDAYEYRHFENLTTATATSDTDGDGQSDLFEYRANTSPLDPAENLSFVVTGGNEAGSTTAYHLFVGAGRIVILQQSTTLAPAAWNNARVFPPSAAPLTFSGNHSSPVSNQKFFRLKVERPLQP